MRYTITRLFAALIPLLAVGSVATTPLPVLAQSQSPQRSMARIDSFQIDLSDQLAPGSEMEFSLSGTPRGQASIRLTGIQRVIVLTEV